MLLAATLFISELGHLVGYHLRLVIPWSNVLLCRTGSRCLLVGSGASGCLHVFSLKFASTLS